MNKRVLCMGLALLCSLSFLGCGGDDDDSDAGDSGSSMTRDGGGTPGTGGAGDMTGSGGSSMTGTGGTTVMTAMPIKCGTNTCQPPAGLGAAFGGIAGTLGVALPMAVPCCMDDDSCGTAAMTGATCEAPAVPDTRCPQVAGGMGLGGAGCCTDSGQCGIDGALLGRGCVENGAARTMLGPLAAIIMVPPSQACDAVTDGDAGADQDAGN